MPEFTWKIGKYKDQGIDQLPDDYLTWAAANLQNKAAAKAAAEELRSRGLDVPAVAPRNKDSEAIERINYRTTKIETMVTNILAGVNSLLRANGMSEVEDSAPIRNRRDYYDDRDSQDDRPADGGSRGRERHHGQDVQDGPDCPF